MTKKRSPRKRRRAKTSSQSRTPPILAVVGRSRTGKTTLVERLIHALTERGYAVGTMKDAKGGFQLDLEGKDTDKHYRAGAQAVAVISAEHGQMAFFARLSEEPCIDELCERLFSGVDLIILEGFKWLNVPKIETTRGDALSCEGDANLIAVVGEPTRTTGDVPCLALDDVAALVSLIERKFRLIESTSD